MLVLGQPDRAGESKSCNSSYTSARMCAQIAPNPSSGDTTDYISFRASYPIFRDRKGRLIPRSARCDNYGDRNNRNCRQDRTHNVRILPAIAKRSPVRYAGAASIRCMDASGIEELGSGVAKRLIFQPISVDGLSHRPKHDVHGNEREEGGQ